MGDEPLHFFTSPYVRCKETYRLLIESGEFNYAGVHEDARLRDCDLGNFHDLETLRSSFRERETFGKFFYRFPHGESGADVCDRVTSFLESLHRGSWSMPVGTNVVVLGHGLTTKLMVMRWFRLSVNDFEAMKTPPAGELLYPGKAAFCQRSPIRTRRRRRSNSWATKTICQPRVVSRKKE